jgi:hypothetical protein
MPNLRSGLATFVLTAVLSTSGLATVAANPINNPMQDFDPMARAAACSPRAGAVDYSDALD